MHSSRMRTACLHVVQGGEGRHSDLVRGGRGGGRHSELFRGGGGGGRHSDLVWGGMGGGRHYELVRGEGIDILNWSGGGEKG